MNQKKLVAGDAIVFLRSASGELCVGVRRSMRGSSGADSSTWHSSSATAASAIRASRWEVKGTESFSDFLGGVVDSGHGGPNNVSRSGNQGSSSTSSFARNRARVSAKSVLEAASLAVSGLPFEVVYYPRASTAEFCVKAALVKQALDHTWYAGMRFKMAFETEDSSRISWFMGTIAAVQSADPLLWPNSPWRVLQASQQRSAPPSAYLPIQDMFFVMWISYCWVYTLLKKKNRLGNGTLPSCKFLSQECSKVKT